MRGKRSMHTPSGAPPAPSSRRKSLTLRRFQSRRSRTANLSDANLARCLLSQLMRACQPRDGFHGTELIHPVASAWSTVDLPPLRFEHLHVAAPRHRVDRLTHDLSHEAGVAVGAGDREIVRARNDLGAPVVAPACAVEAPHADDLPVRIRGDEQRRLGEVRVRKVLPAQVTQREVRLETERPAMQLDDRVQAVGAPERDLVCGHASVRRDVAGRSVRSNRRRSSRGRGPRP